MEPTTRVELMACRLRIGKLHIETLNLNDLALRKQAPNRPKSLHFRTPDAPEFLPHWIVLSPRHRTPAFYVVMSSQGEESHLKCSTEDNNSWANCLISAK